MKLRYALAMFVGIGLLGIAHAQTSEETPFNNEDAIQQFETAPSTPEPVTPAPSDSASKDALQKLQACRERLAQIGAAIRAFRAAHDGQNPQWLSDLFPDALPDATLLLCPADDAGGDPLWETDPDPKLPTSYAYEFAPTRYETGRSSYRLYGEIVPLVRCWHHLGVPLEENGASPNETVLTLDYGLRVRAGLPEWESDPHLIQTTFEEVKAALDSGTSEALAAIHFGVVSFLTPEMRAILAERLAGMEALPENADNGGLFKLLGAYYRAFENPQRAVPYYEKAAQLLPNDPEIHLLLGVLYNGQGRAQEALAEYEQGIRLQPDTVDVILELARLYRKSNNNENLENLYKLLQSVFRPESFGYRFVMAELAYYVGDYTAALDSLTWILRHFPADTPLTDITVRTTIERMATIYDLQGDRERSKQLRLQIEPGYKLIGTTAPDFSGVDSKGNPIRKADFAGKAMILTFWGSWGPFCQKEMERLAGLYKTYAPEGLTVIGLNQGTNRQTEILYASIHAPYPQVYDAGQAFSDYFIRVIPTTLYINRDGTILYRDVGVEERTDDELAARVREMLAPPSEKEASPTPGDSDE